EPNQSIKTLVFTISNLANGSNEVINVDGSQVQLTQGFTTTTPGDAMLVSVTVNGTTATLTLTHNVGISAAAAQTLVEGMNYSNNSNDPGVGSRTVTLTALQATGGTANGGLDTASLNIAAV